MDADTSLFPRFQCYFRTRFLANGTPLKQEYEMIPFDRDELPRLFARHNIPQLTQSMIERAFIEPTRRVEPTLKSSPEIGACPKMGLVIQAANRTVERPAVLHYMFDDSVSGYLDRPFELNLAYRSRSNRTIRRNHYPQFLWFGPQGFFVDDWVSPQLRQNLLKHAPGLYTQVDRQIRCAPAEHAAAELGLQYRLRCSDELAGTGHRNREFLKSYLWSQPHRSDTDLKFVLEYVSRNGVCTLQELLGAKRDVNRDQIYLALAHSLVVADFDRSFVQDVSEFLLFRDAAARDLYYRDHFSNRPRSFGQGWSPELFRPGHQLYYAGASFTIIASSNLHLIIKPENGDPFEMTHELVAQKYRSGLLVPDGACESVVDPLVLDSPLRYATPKAVQHASDMLNLYEKWKDGERSADVQKYSDRTWRSYARRESDAVSRGQDPLIAFLPRWHLRGNHTSKVDSGTDDIIQKAIQEHYETLIGPSKWNTYGSIRAALELAGLRVVSKNTFLKRIKKILTCHSIGKRRGHKAAYQEAPFYWVLERNTPTHGDYPMQITHIDHTELEIIVISKLTGEELGRPWLTLIICAFSRRILGFHISLRNPRYRSCMCALFDMTRRYGRVPDQIVIDGGSDLGSIDFEQLCAFLRIDILMRPKSAPRAGSVLERMFGTTQSEFIYNLWGNTKLLRNVREITPQSDPENLARLTLEDIYEGLSKFFFSIYDTTRHPALLVSPASRFEIGLAASGRRLHRLRREADMIPVAFPSVRGRTRKIDCQRGIWVNYQYYRNPRLEKREFDGLEVVVKPHLLYPDIAYALVNHEWFPLYSTKFGSLDKLSDYKRRSLNDEYLTLQRYVEESQQDSAEQLASLTNRINSRDARIPDEPIVSIPFETDKTVDPLTDEDVNTEEELKQKFSHIFEELKKENFRGHEL
ncbi:integrase catalytic domain-containing protein [Burkholderia sp. B21-005]|uniref:integrase catalytic domain-containing protein n=1 Tax=Burkholderia sp. B21-005 TaxID=2890406 RepID=UPI001E345028|nr:transposase family protein [Burkholderia sp. B21-005]UEP45255.1 transposase family protein [Burkholderia sp. B21-005]